jgi:restriction endonuclease S subunit
MGLIQTIKFSDFSNDKLFRIDSKFHFLNQRYGWNIFDAPNNDLIPLKQILTPTYEIFEYQNDNEYKGIPTGRDYLSEFGDIISHQSVTKDEHPNRLKYKVDNNCILISSLKGAKTPALSFNFDLSNYVFSNGFYIFKVSNLWNKQFILYLLRTKIIKNALDNNIYRGIGISSYKEDDLLKIQIPNIDLSLQNKAIQKIEPIEKEIQKLKLQKKKYLNIINDVFSQELKFDWDKFNDLKNQKIFISSLFQFSQNKDIRCGYKFHNLANQYLYKFLVSKTDKKIKDFISDPIVLGKSISPKLYDEYGEHYYIAMSNIKNYRFDTQDCKKVGIKYFTDNKNKSIQLNDILLARSGEGTIGKVAIIEDKEVEGIFADFTMRIRLTNYNQLFAYYYFRSDFFQYLVYTHKKGLGNNTNIFPSQLQEFPLLNFTLKKQQKIVNNIKTKIDIQKDIENQIKQKQDSISFIIEECIKGNGI